MAQRTFDDDEVAEILDRATRNPGPFKARPALPKKGTRTEVSLAELQSIGAAAGIPPERIAAVARELVGQRPTGYPELTLKLRIPRELNHRIPLSGPVAGEDWDRLVSVFRTQFGGDGSVEGNLRSWKLDDVSACVEPDPLGEGWRLRLTACPKDVWEQFGVSAALIPVGALTMMAGALLALGPSVTILGFAALVAGVGMAGWAWLQLPHWVRRRSAQMQEVGDSVGRYSSASPPPE